jgi:hypothetical protein
MATVMAAPFAATLLGDYGADIIKVENPSNPDAIRGWGVIEKAGVSPFWAVVGRNKFPVTLNLKTAEGKRIFTDLTRKADVLIENMRPGVMEKLGIGREALIEENPGLVIGTVSGYGQTGPFSMSFDSEGLIDPDKLREEIMLFIEILPLEPIIRYPWDLVEPKRILIKRLHDNEYRWDLTPEIETAILEATFGIG